MPLSIPVVWTDAHRRHDPDGGSARSGYRRSSCRKAATTFTAIDALVRAVLEGFEEAAN